MADRIDYGRVRRELAVLRNGDLRSSAAEGVIARLIGDFGALYSRFRPQAQVVEIALEGFNYLFDVGGERNIAAYGFMRGKNSAKRNASRMSGYPKPVNKAFQKGHMIPHSGHGGEDINLFFQHGKVNTGRFRHLENQAVKQIGSFYFVYLEYPHLPLADRASAVEQGLISPTSPPTLEYARFLN